MSDDRPPRPDPLTFDPHPVPETLRDREQWVCWRYKWDADRDEWTKIPVDATTGGFAKSTDPDTWVSFADAVAYHDGEDTDTDGVGFVVSEGDHVVGVDLDDCRDPETGDLAPWSETLLRDVPTYAEVSPSGTGLRLFGIGLVPDGGNRSDIDGAEGHLEIYDSGRYLTVTGHALTDDPENVREVNDALDAVHAEYIRDDEDAPDTPKTAGDGGVQATSPGPNPGVGARKSGSLDGPRDLSDEELLNRALNADNGEKFRRLFDRGDTSDYPSQSEADLALCGLLAFWTGGDRTRMDQLFRRSGLYRDKWDEDRGAKTYGERTIDEALSGQTEFYDPEDDRNRPTNPGATVDDADRVDVSLTPGEVIAWAGRDGVEDVADLTDREKAACVWDLMKRHDEFHVRVRRDNGTLWAYNDGVWSRNGERALRHAARRALGSMNYGQNVLNELQAQALSDPSVEVAADGFGLAPGNIAVENGLVDLEAAANGAGEDALRDLQPDDYALARLPVEYDPDATADEWKTFVGEVVEPSKIDTVQEYVGYTLHRGATPFHKALLCVGSGANGKSTFLNVVRALLGGDHTTSKPIHKFDEDNHVADLYGALANIDADLSEGSLSSKGIATFKRLIGGDTVDARRLYEDAFSFAPTVKHLYACNQVPDVSNYVDDHDIAFWRRWIIVEFPKWFPKGSDERDEHLEDRLTADENLSGVLNWAIDGWAQLLDQGGFTNVEDHDQTRRLWQSWGESVEQFIAECVERDEDAPRFSTGDAYARYQAWCRETGADPVGRRRFTDTLKQEDVEYGRHRIGGTVKRGYDALGLSDDVPDPDDGAGDDDDPDGGSQKSLDDV